MESILRYFFNNNNNGPHKGRRSVTMERKRAVSDAPLRQRYKPTTRRKLLLLRLEDEEPMEATLVNHHHHQRKRSEIVCSTQLYSGIRMLTFLTLAILFMVTIVAGDFIDKVECEKDKMVVYINEAKVQEDYPAIGVDKYSVYVHQFKDTCNDQGVVSQSNSLKSKRFVVPLNAGCGINSQADNTMGIHKEWLVYQATVRLEAIKPRSPDGRILEQRVKCVYSTSHQATASSNRLLVKSGDSTTGAMSTSGRQAPVLGAGTVEGSAPPIENFIELFFASPDAKFSVLQEATIGDAVRIVLRMSHNVAYSAMKPEFCIISNKPYANRNDPDFRELIIVNSGCSVQSTPPLIPKMVYRASLAAGEPEMFYSKFTMFKMGDYSELHAMCNVKLCISSSERACDTTQPRGCFESVRRRRRKKRSPDRWTINNDTALSLPRRLALFTAMSKHQQQQQKTLVSSGFNIPALTSNSYNPSSGRNARLLFKPTPTAPPDTTTPAAVVGGMKPFNPDLLTVSGRLHVHQQHAPTSAAFNGAQLCFHSITFSVMAAVLAWLFVLALSCVIMLSCLLRTRQRVLDKTGAASTCSAYDTASFSASSATSAPPSTTSTVQNASSLLFDAALKQQQQKQCGGVHRRDLRRASYAQPPQPPAGCTSANGLCALAAAAAAAAHRYEGDVTMCCGGNVTAETSGGESGGGGEFTTLKLRRVPLDVQRRRSLLLLAPSQKETVTTKQQFFGRGVGQEMLLVRHNTLKPTPTSSATSSSSSSTSSSSVCAASSPPSSPSPAPFSLSSSSAAGRGCGGGAAGGARSMGTCYDDILG